MHTTWVTHAHHVGLINRPYLERVASLSVYHCFPGGHSDQILDLFGPVLDTDVSHMHTTLISHVHHMHGFSMYTTLILHAQHMGLTGHMHTILISYAPYISNILPQIQHQQILAIPQSHLQSRCQIRLHRGQIRGSLLT